MIIFENYLFFFILSGHSLPLVLSLRSRLNLNMTLKPKISIIIPVYRDLGGLKKTIRSIENQDFSDVEIIIINDGADPETDMFCIDKGFTTKTISPNLGSYNARNEGIKLATSDSIAFTDADVEVSPNWIETGLSYLGNYDYVAGNVQISREKVYDLATFHDYLTAFPVEEYLNDHHFGVTANLFVKKSVFDKLGLFDPELRSGGDLEFGDRVYSAGISQIFAAECWVEHPPRGHHEKLAKFKRVKNGQKHLLDKYPNRFEFLRKQNNLKGYIRRLVPPSIKSASRLYRKEKLFSFWKFYGYQYRWKLLCNRYK